MADEMNNNDTIKILFCGLSTQNTEHICEEPIRLLCDHCVCKKCLKPEIDHKKIKCYNCQSVNEKELTQIERPTYVSIHTWSAINNCI